MSDRITLTGIEAFGRHGVFEHERADGQRFRVDATLWLDLGPAGESDDLVDTVDYGGVAQAIVADVERDPLDLIEALAARIARTCLTDARVREVEVTVHKPMAPVDVPFDDIAVTVRRSRT
ncbi:dihydroneopterin aldolase [Mariniluteicoccus flavus]